MKEARCYPVVQRQEDGSWTDFLGVELGDINGGIGIATFKELIDLEDGRLVSEATGDVFYRTQKDVASGDCKKYYNRDRGVLVTVYDRHEPDGGWIRS